MSTGSEYPPYGEDPTQRSARSSQRCPKCGTLVPDGALHCPKCGHELTPHSGGPAWWAVALALIVGFAIAFAIFHLAGVGQSTVTTKAPGATTQSNHVTVTAPTRTLTTTETVTSPAQTVTDTVTGTGITP